MKVNFITKQEAQLILKPFIATILDCVESSVNRYFSGPELSSVRHLFSKRSDASNCHDLIKNSIMDEFENVPGIRHFTTRELFLLVIQSRVVLRFKLLDKNLLSHGIHTQQLFSYNNQDVEQLELPNMPPHGLLHVGYTVNDLRTGIEDVFVTCRYGNHNYWEWDLSEEKIVATVTHLEFPAKDAARTTKRRALPKHKTDVGDINANI